MKEKTKEKYSAFSYLILLCSVLVITAILFAIFTGGSYYIDAIHNSLKKQTVSQLSAITKEQAETFESLLADDFKAIQTFQSGLSALNTNDNEYIDSMLDVIASSEYTYTLVDLTHGILYTNRSDDPVILTAEERLAYEKSCSHSDREAFYRETDGIATIGFHLHFTFQDGANGILFKERYVSDVSKKYTLNGSKPSYIINSDGDFLIFSENEDFLNQNSNLFTFLKENKENKPNELQALSTALHSSESGSMSLFLNQEEHILIYVPIDGTSWYYLSVLPDSEVMQRANEMISESRLFITIAQVGMLIFLAFVLILIFSRHRLLQKDSELRYRDTLFHILASQTNDIFVMLSSDDFHVEYLSPNIERLLGIPYEDAIENIEQIGILYEADVEHGGYSYLKQIPLGHSTTMEGGRIHQKTGENLWFSETIYHYLVNECDRYIICLSDRTLEKESRTALENALDMAKQANMSKTNFLSNMSHDIRTPMNTIVGICKLLEYHAGDKALVLEDAKKITSASNHLLGLLNDILDMSKIESDKLVLHSSLVRLDDLLAEVDSIIRPQAKQKEMQFEIRKEHVVHSEFPGDALRLKQILLNLLSNSVKYTPAQGTVILTIRELHKTDDHYIHLQFHVYDNGIGISKEYEQYLYDPFSRDHDHINAEIHGSGLGMPITKNLVTLMGGTISLKSVLHEFTLFTVQLKFPKIYVSQTTPVVTKKGPDINYLDHLHCLLAEDTEVNADIFVSLLELHGATCDVASNGKEALSRFEASEKGFYDVIFLDIQMPVMNGYETSIAIRNSTHPDASSIPIIALTANAFADDVKNALDAGMSAHASKPIDIEAIQKILSKLL